MTVWHNIIGDNLGGGADREPSPKKRRMHWSLSEFLNLLEVRSQCWGFVDVAAESGFRIRRSGDVLLYASLAGVVTISNAADSPLTLEHGDTIMIVSGIAHAVRTSPNAQVRTVKFLNDDEFADTPHHVTLSGPGAARLLCGRLKVRWPGGVEAQFLPAALTVKSESNFIDLEALSARAHGVGSAALLTRAAALLLTSALRDHPECYSIFRDANFRDPISRAVQFMNRHFHRDWTVAELAAKVGMGRSTFASRFLVEVGKPPMEVLTDIRMREAMKLLTQTRVKICEVGERVGYRSQSAFSRRFESYFRQTPGKMRSLQGAGNASTATGLPARSEQDKI